ncbi:hypothetical protein M440DRAFT_1457051 [Trichoderma longibrachiatum ATCC 18648]|uniref:Uncharacterized protein n=1 Tax=Trichoderma longibrachiatum ATCC 18648 TaxID=983965 RepID=A0A2T4C3U2_TRILO|nr:hypothetical protein M440DRAFT_1457051 [Trichoderma longibrachiatum ATCC 18648]
MAHNMDKDIYATVNSFYGLNRNPECSMADLVAMNAPIVRYIAAEAQASRRLVFEVAAVEQEAIQHLIIEYVGLAFYCTGTELEAMMEEMQGQGSASDVDDKIRAMMDAELSRWKEDPDMAPGLEDVFIHRWIVGKLYGSDGVETDNSFGDGPNGGTDQALDGVQQEEDESKEKGEKEETEEEVVVAE